MKIKYNNLTTRTGVLFGCFGSVLFGRRCSRRQRLPQSQPQAASSRRQRHDPQAKPRKRRPRASRWRSWRRRCPRCKRPSSASTPSRLVRCSRTLLLCVRIYVRRFPVLFAVLSCTVCYATYICTHIIRVYADFIFNFVVFRCTICYTPCV